MNQLQVFESELFKVSAKFINGEILFDVEQVAKSLGITTDVNGVEYVRWSRVNSYLPKNLPQVAKGDLIPEPLVYKLAFKASNDIAEKFQDWLAVSVIPSIRKTGSYNLKQPQTIEDLIIMQAQSVKELKVQVSTLGEAVTTIQDTFLKRDENWRDSINKMLNKAAFKLGGNYRELRNKSYELLEERGRCNLNQRLRNLLERLEQSGATKTQINRTSKMDVIEADARLKEIYSNIIKELSIGSIKAV